MDFMKACSTLKDRVYSKYQCLLCCIPSQLEYKGPFFLKRHMAPWIFFNHIQQGEEFLSFLWQQLFRNLETHLKNSSSFHLQMDNQFNCKQTA